MFQKKRTNTIVTNIRLFTFFMQKKQYLLSQTDLFRTLSIISLTEFQKNFRFISRYKTIMSILNRYQSVKPEWNYCIFDS